MTKTIITEAKASPPKKGSYPDGYCFKCNAKMKTVSQETVILKNHKRAVKGICARCEGQVYRLLAKGDRRTVEASNTAKSPGISRLQVETKVASTPRQSNPRQATKPAAKQNRPTRKMSPYPAEEKPKAHDNFVDIVLLSVILTLAAALFVIVNATMVAR